MCACHRTFRKKHLIEQLVILSLVDICKCIVFSGKQQETDLEMEQVSTKVQRVESKFIQTCHSISIPNDDIASSLHNI